MHRRCLGPSFCSRRPAPQPCPGSGTRGFEPATPCSPKPDRAPLSPARMGNGTGRCCFVVVRGCPLGTVQDRCEWHARGTAGRNDDTRACQRRLPAHQRVRPVPGVYCFVDKSPEGSRRPAYRRLVRVTHLRVSTLAGGGHDIVQALQTFFRLPFETQFSNVGGGTYVWWLYLLPSAHWSGHGA
jgi:hypothetical protein